MSVGRSLHPACCCSLILVAALSLSVSLRSCAFNCVCLSRRSLARLDLPGRSFVVLFRIRHNSPSAAQAQQSIYAFAHSFTQSRSGKLFRSAFPFVAILLLFLSLTIINPPLIVPSHPFTKDVVAHRSPSRSQGCCPYPPVRRRCRRRCRPIRLHQDAQGRCRRDHPCQAGAAQEAQG